MKKIWKRLCLIALVFASVFGFAGCSCSKNKNAESVDLDGDGAIALWETVYLAAPASNREVLSPNKVFVEDLAGLKAIDGKASNTSYILTNDIDCGGEALSINLGSSNYIYGNNHYIANYNLGNPKLAELTEGETLSYHKGVEDYVKNGKVNTFIFNGAGIFDLRLFMGLEDLAIDTDKEGMHYSASNFLEIGVIENVEIRGAIKTKMRSDSGDSVAVSVTLGANTNEDFKNSSVIRNITINGKIDYSDGDAEKESYINIGGVTPLAEYNSVISNANVDVQITSNTNIISGTRPISVGLIAGINKGFITTANTAGAINIAAKGGESVYCGGIVGRNNVANESLGVAEIKNAATTALINFESAIVSGQSTNYSVGGIVGENNYGIVDYCVSDAVITGQNLRTTMVGGIAGCNREGILDTLITRGVINLNNAVTQTDVASIAGRSEKGVIKHVLSTTPINIDNTSTNVYKVNLGMATVFETGSVTCIEPVPDTESETITHTYHNTEKTPLFEGILITGTYKVRRLPTASSNNDYVYDLGLRDLYYDKKPLDDISDYGELITTLPKIYSGLYYLYSQSGASGSQGAYQVIEETVAGDTTTTKDIAFTCAKLSNASDAVKPAAESVVFKPDWFVKNIGFNYGLNHNEVDVSKVNTTEKAASLNTIVFTLDDEFAKTRYFEQKKYNGELSYFDSMIEGIYYYNSDESYSAQDEFFSYLTNYIASGKTGKMTDLLIIEKYFQANPNLGGGSEEEGEEGPVTQDMTKLPSHFLTHLKSMLSKIYDVPVVTLINDKGELVYSSEDVKSDTLDESQVQYVKCTLEGESNKYVLTFDLTKTMGGTGLFGRTYSYPNISEIANSSLYLVTLTLDVLPK